MLGYLSSGGNGKLCNIRIGECQAFYIRHISIQHHLVDVAGGDHFFIDNRADVETFRHADIVDILHLRNSLFHSHAFGGETGKDVGFGIPGQGNEGFCVFQPFFNKKIHVTAVPVDNHRLVIQ